MASNVLSFVSLTGPVAHTLVGYPSPAREVAVRLALRTRQPTAADLAAHGDLLSRAPHQRRYLTHDEVAAATGGYTEDVAALEAYFHPFNIRLQTQSLVTGRVTLAGTVADFERALNTRVAAFQATGQRALLAATDYQLPDSLRTAVRLEQPVPPTYRKESRLPVPAPQPPTEALLATAEPVELGHPVPDFGRAYQFPAGATGQGQVIGIVELGGQLNRADLDTFFEGLGLATPQLTEVGTPPPSSPDTVQVNNAEVALDIQLAGTLAPGAKLVVYYGTTLLEALQAVVSDADNKPSVLSVSWAGAEYKYSAEEVQEMHKLLYQAALLGITVVAASADLGAFNGTSVPNVSLLASDPLVLGCGGTIATLNDGQLTNEVVWNDLGGRLATGGGYSYLYAQPYYQVAAAACYPYQRAATRGVPDVAANASTNAADCYRVLVAGNPAPGGGTSAATPLLASLLALLSEQLGYRLGFVNPTLYSFAGTAAFRPITQGNNNYYPAAPIWNPCTGLGSPVGTELLAQFKALEQAAPAHPDSGLPADTSPETIDVPHTVEEDSAPAAPQPGADEQNPAEASPSEPTAAEQPPSEPGATPVTSPPAQDSTASADTPPASPADAPTGDSAATTPPASAKRKRKHDEPGGAST